MKITKEMSDSAFNFMNSVYDYTLSESNLDNVYVRTWFARAIEHIYRFDMPDIPTQEELSDMMES
jgi:hypothetical protein